MINKHKGNMNFAKYITSMNTSFSNDFSCSTVTIGDISLRGDGVSFNGKMAKIGAMGEYIERHTQSTVSHKVKDKYQEAFNVNSEQIEKVNILDMILPKYHLFEENDGIEWSDSSGTAFHTSSIDAIDSAFLEFIERQSLVYNWLLKLPGKKIDLNFCSRNDEHIEKAYRNLKAYFINIESYEISITPNCKVVITIATSKLNKSVGLGSAWDMKSAIFKSLKETWQLISHKSPSHLNIQYDHYEKELSDDGKGLNLYADYFHELTVKDVKTAYDFLDGGEHFSFNENKNLEKRPSDSKYINTMKSIAEELNIELLITYIPSSIENLPGYIVKVIGKGSFPHIKTDIIDPYKYTIKDVHMNKIIPNKGIMIPFS